MKRILLFSTILFLLVVSCDDKSTSGEPCPDAGSCLPCEDAATCDADAQPCPDAAPVAPQYFSPHDYFPPSYGASRENFLQWSRYLETRYSGVERGVFPVPSATDNDLTMDWLYIPAQESAGKLLIITTGVHGIEGFLGSMALQHFFDEVLGALDLRHTGVLVFHAVNPWGFRHLRRVSENNVDLNRNFDVTPDLFDKTNEIYADINPYLNPTGPVDYNWDYYTSELLLLPALAMYSFDEIKASVLGGQYEYPDGIYFGGNTFEPQKAALEEVVLGKCAAYGTVMLFDIHSAYGDRGKLHLLGNEGYTQLQDDTLDEIFSGWLVERTGDQVGEGYNLSGDITVYMGDLLPDKFYLTVTLEYGTLDTLGLEGGKDALNRTILENQGAHYGYAEVTDQQRVEEDFFEMFHPTARPIREAFYAQTKQMLLPAFQRFIALP